MDLEHTVLSASPENGAPLEAVAESSRRARRRRKAKIEAALVPDTPAEASTTPEAQGEPTAAAKAEHEAPPVASPVVPVSTEPHDSARAVPALAVPLRKPITAQSSFLRKHGALAAGMALALGFGAYAGTQIGIERASETAAAQSSSVNVAAALPWKRDVAMASTQTREIARLKEELRGVRAQVDSLKANPDQARQAQELRSLRASVETLKDGLAVARSDTASAIAQVASSQASKGSERDQQQRVEKFAERLDRLERQLSDPTPTAAIPQKAEAAKSVALPEARALPDPHALPTPAEVAAAVQRAEPRAKIFRNYVVREVADGVALIEGPDGLREVWPGRGIPGAGKVTAIERQAGKWVVITSEGLIEYKRDAYLSVH
jgi:hypothetical protein